MPPRKKNTAPPIEATGLSASTMNAFNIMLQASNQSAKRTPARKTPTRKASARKAPARKAPAPNVSALNALGPNAPAPNFLGSNAPESKAPASRAPARGKSKTSTSWTHLLSRAQNRTQAINKAARQGLITTSAAQMQIAQIWKDFETTRAHLSRGFTQNPNAPGQSADVLQAAEGNPSAARQIPTEDEYEDDDEDEENMGVVETYSEYMPTKLKIGKKHPDAVVETATLASVIPPDITYQLTIPKEFINAGTLSALQLESITYASQKHEHFLPDKTRAGFLIGDGAGVGKGRTVAGIIWENFLNGRKKAIWISVSSDLKYDAERDLRDIGASNISVYPLTKMKYARISAAINGSVTEGVVFCTYSALIGGSQSSGQFRTRLAQLVQWCGDDFDGVIIFDECHRAKNLVPASGSKPTKTGMAVVELQNKLPKARVVYASATGASETKNMAYMVRLGLWGEETPFREFKDFQKTVEGRGVGAMEIVAMEMKHRGMYIARQLSFQNVAFRIEEVPLTPEFVAVYDDSVKFWVKLMDEFEHAIELVRTEGKDQNIIWAQFWGAHQRFFKYLCIAAKVKHAVKVANEGIEAGKCVVIGLQSTGEARTLDQLEADGSLSDFVSSAKGVVQSLVEKHFPGQQNSKLDVHKALGIDMAEYGEDGNDGPSNTRRSTRQPPKKKTRSDFYAADLTVFGSYSDDAFSIESDSDSDFPDYDPFAAKQVVAERGPKAKSKESESKFRRYIYASMDENSNVIGGKVSKGRKRKKVADEDGKASSKRKPGKLAMKAVKETKERLMAEIELLGARLPTNTLDQLIDELGGPDKVAEMTGRKGRVVQDCHGKVQYESREEDEVGMEDLNREEKERFMNGEKDVAIISEAASSGISLQADRRVGNQRRRVHITLELPWSADRAIQQFGRTHRSNQVSAPEYVFLISDLAGERRFASAVAKRLESLGALTHGDRRATETRDLSQYNIYTKFGRLALTAVMRSVTGNATPKVPHPADYKGDFFPDVLASLKGVGFFGKKKSEDDSSEEEEDDTALSKHYGNIPKFLNRILGLPVDLQNRLFKYFMDTLGVVITEARKAGRYDKGILDLGTEHDNVRKIKVDSFTTRHSTGTSKIELTTVEMDRGITWEAAKEKHALLFENHEGFYIQIKPTWVGNSSVALVVKGLNGTRRGADKVEQFYSLYRPNLGLMVQQETIAEIKLKYKKISVEQAERYWKEQYEFYKHKCYHMFLAGSCRNTMAGLRCVSGMRQCTYYVLSGSLLAVWDKVQEIYQRRAKNNRLQVVRMRIEGGERIVGTDIPSYCVEPVLQMLSGDTEDMDDESF